MLKRLQGRVLYRFAGEIETETRAQLTELRDIFREAMSAWEESRRDAETTTVTAGRRMLTCAGAVDLPDLRVVETRTPCGSARFLVPALAAKAGLRELPGLNGRREVRVETGGEAPVLIRVVDQGTNDGLRFLR